MILFQEEHVEPILNGTKTQTRRIWARQRAKVGATHLAKTKMLSKDFFAKVEIVRVFQETLGDISESDAKAEGYSSVEGYLRAFKKINKLTDVELQEALKSKIWVVEFKKVFP